MRRDSSISSPSTAEQGAVGHDLVAPAEHEEVVEHDVLRRHLDHGAVADDASPGCAQHGETVERALGPHLLDDADQRVGDQDEAEESVAP